ncbi:MAG: hypothetical protein OXF94_01320 [Gammaproteobacteria bacterium]|nr:hypothetical protein [Gammaproteobacteria bacterium]
MNRQTALLRIAGRKAPVGRPSSGPRLALMLAGILLATSSPAGEQDLEPVTRQPWQEVVVSVSHIDRTARFFLGIGGYEAKWRGPLDSALAAAWELPQEASGSELRVVIYRGPDGVQVQGYERLKPPLPESIPAFETLTGPFNMMQMVRDRDATHDFFTRILGFGSYYKGDPFLAPEPTPTPLGIPLSLTTTVPYRAGIVETRPGEFGRMEFIEVMGMSGFDYSDRCRAPNLGTLAVRFEVGDAVEARNRIRERGWAIRNEIRRVRLEPYGDIDLFAVETPDGAIIQFYSAPK